MALRESLVSLLVVSLLVTRGSCQSADGNQEGSQDWAMVGEVSARELIENPRDQKAWAALVAARMNQDDLKRAEQALKEWRTTVSSPAAASEKLDAELAFTEGDTPRAVNAWKRYLHRAPKDDAAWKQLAAVYGDEKDFANGVDAMGSALALRADAEGFVQRARLRIRMHDWAGAESDVRQANRMDSTNADAQALFPIFERSATWQPPMSALDQIVQKNPDDFQSRLNRAEWLRWSGFTEAAQDDIEAAFQMDPKSLRARLWRGLAAQERLAADRTAGDDEKSSRVENDKAAAGDVMPMDAALISTDFERELKAADAETDPEARARFLLKYHQPVMALREVQEGSPARAQALVDLDRLPEAGRSARLATQQHPGDAMAWMALARWELANGNYRETLDAVNRSARLGKTPETEDLRKTALLRLGTR